MRNKNAHSRENENARSSQKDWQVHEQEIDFVEHILAWICFNVWIKRMKKKDG